MAHWIAHIITQKDRQSYPHLNARARACRSSLSGTDRIACRNGGGTPGEARGKIPTIGQDCS